MFSPLGYPISSFTPLPVSAEAELRLISRNLLRILLINPVKGSFGRNQLSPNSIDVWCRKHHFSKAELLISPLAPGHASDLNLNNASEPPSRFPWTLLCPGLDRRVSGLAPVTRALSHPVPSPKLRHIRFRFGYLTLTSPQKQTPCHVFQNGRYNLKLCSS